MENADVTQQFEAAWSMNEDELYEHLGMASLGTESVSEAMGSFQMLKSITANTDSVEVAQFFGGLYERGKNYFWKLWHGIKEGVCKAYREGKTIGNKKDLGAYLVGIVIKAGKIVNPLASLVIAAAIKLGLDTLCAAK